MAIIKFGSIITGVRGTLGGMICSANKSSNFARQWSGPRQPRTYLQTTWRAYIASFPAAWRSLSSAQKTAWDTWAALPAQARTNSLGETYYMSGYQAFCSVAAKLAVFAQSPRTAPPTNSVPSAPTITSFTAYASGGSASNIVYPSGQFTGYYQLIEAATLSGSGSQVCSSGYFTCFTDTSPHLTTESFQSELEAVLGSISVGQHIFIRVYRQYSDSPRSAAVGIEDVAS